MRALNALYSGQPTHGPTIIILVFAPSSAVLRMRGQYVVVNAVVPEYVPHLRAGGGGVRLSSLPVWC